MTTTKLIQRNYKNLDERYGGQVICAIEDYRHINPAGKFREICGEILEIFPNGDSVAVAVVATKELENIK